MASQDDVAKLNFSELLTLYEIAVVHCYMYPRQYPADDTRDKRAIFLRQEILKRFQHLEDLNETYRTTISDVY